MADPTTLYRAYDATGRLLYIGISKNWGRRWTQHAERSPWYRDVARLDLESHPTREAAYAAERRAVQAEHPVHNIEHTARDTRPWACTDDQPEWIVRSFDHRFTLGEVPEYVEAMLSINKLANALNAMDFGLTQETMIAAIGDATRAIVYGDCCAICRDSDPNLDDNWAAHLPLKVDVDGAGLIAQYRCRRCDRTWSTYWAVDAVWMMA